MEDIDVGSSETEAAISSVFVDIHAAVQAASADMEATMGRVNYVTPSAFLELVTGYVKLLKEKRETLGDAANKLRNGLLKLQQSDRSV